MPLLTRACLPSSSVKLSVDLVRMLQCMCTSCTVEISCATSVIVTTNYVQQKNAQQQKALDIESCTMCHWGLDSHHH